MKLECQHLIHAAGWWLWNKLCQRVAAARFHWAAADSGCAEVTAGRRFCSMNCSETFYAINLKSLSPQSGSSQKWVKLQFEELRFQCIPELQTVNFKPTNGSGRRKEDAMVLGNEVIIVIQDKDAYRRRQEVWGVNERALTLSAAKQGFHE